MGQKGKNISEKERLKIIETKKERIESGYYSIERYCVFCKKKLKYNQKRFCCSKHAGLFRTGVNHPNYKNGYSISKKPCIRCGQPILLKNKTKRCRKCFVFFNKKENHSAYKNGCSVSICIDCGKEIKGNCKRCLPCYKKYNHGKNNSMYGRRGRKTNRWCVKPIKYCKACGKKLQRNSKSNVHISCYQNEFTPLWKGGISREPYGMEWNRKLKRRIISRDKNNCQNTKYWGNPKRISIHHIDYCKTNCNTNNLITLCTSCNSRANINRNYWKKLYTNILKKRGLLYELKSSGQSV
jgi:hypothetical protein